MSAAVAPRPNPFYDATTGNQFVVFHALLLVDKSVAYPSPDHFVGRVLTFLEGPWSGKETAHREDGVFEPERLADGTINLAGSTNPSQIVYTFAIDSLGASFDANLSAAVVGNRFLINGLPQNGTGSGYRTVLSVDELNAKKRRAYVPRRSKHAAYAQSNRSF